MESTQEEYETSKKSKKPLTKEECNELKERFSNIAEKLPEIDAILTKISTGLEIKPNGKSRFNLVIE